MIISFFLTGAEKFINRYLQLDPETVARLQALSGKVIAIQFQHFNLKLYLRIESGIIRLLSRYEGIPDVTLRGTAFDFLRLSKATNSSAAIFASDIIIEGDMDVARQFKTIFANLDIDWEEQLSHVAGDTIAHQVGNLVRTLCTWARASSDTLQQDLTEYVQEEIRLVPPRAEIADFFAAVDTVRNDVERLTARIERLEILL